MIRTYILTREETYSQIEFVKLLRHNATVGCSKCKKMFPGGIGNKDFSGFDRNNWQPRTNEEHRREMDKIRQCKTKG